jgi:CRP-like cAMP-binding protein
LHLDGHGNERNRLLRSLSGSSYDALSPQMESLHVELHHQVWQRGDPIPWVYFPRGCVISLVIRFSKGRPVEAGTVGRDGMAGTSLALGAASASTTAFGQVPGAAARMTAADFRNAVERDDTLGDLVLLYAQMLYEQTAQSAACNRKHLTQARCARWLLMTQDAVGAPQFPLTHEFLAMMLGVRRASVSLAAEALKRAKLITYTRGKISVIDRPGLEDESCECYRAVRDRQDVLLGAAS